MSKTLPGDYSKTEQSACMIRVNHAGEYGAKRIYAGQLFILKNSISGPILRHMAQQEEVHLQTFSKMLSVRHIRPTCLMPLWHISAFAMGAASALLGEKAAMACTVAVEEVIDEHYAMQERALSDGEVELKTTISQFRADEKEHHNAALAQGAEQSPFYGLLTAAVKVHTKLAIWLSTRL